MRGFSVIPPGCGSEPRLSVLQRNRWDSITATKFPFILQPGSSVRRFSFLTRASSRSPVNLPLAKWRMRRFHRRWESQKNSRTGETTKEQKNCSSQVSTNQQALFFIKTTHGLKKWNPTPEERCDPALCPQSIDFCTQTRGNTFLVKLLLLEALSTRAATIHCNR